MPSARDSSPRMRRRYEGATTIATARSARPRRREVEEVRDADAAREELALVERRQLAVREARAMERRPEAIAGTREMMADRRGVEPGIDPAEEDAQAGRDHVGDALPARGEQVLAGRPALPRPRRAAAPRPFRQGALRGDVADGPRGDRRDRSASRASAVSS